MKTPQEKATELIPDILKEIGKETPFDDIRKQRAIELIHDNLTDGTESSQADKLMGCMLEAFIEREQRVRNGTIVIAEPQDTGPQKAGETPDQFIKRLMRVSEQSKPVHPESTETHLKRLIDGQFTIHYGIIGDASTVTTSRYFPAHNPQDLIFTHGRDQHYAMYLVVDDILSKKFGGKMGHKLANSMAYFFHTIYPPQDSVLPQLCDSIEKAGITLFKDIRVTEIAGDDRYMGGYEVKDPLRKADQPPQYVKYENGPELKVPLLHFPFKSLLNYQNIVTVQKDGEELKSKVGFDPNDPRLISLARSDQPLQGLLPSNEKTLYHPDPKARPNYIFTCNVISQDDYSIDTKATNLAGAYQKTGELFCAMANMARKGGMIIHLNALPGAMDEILNSKAFCDLCGIEKVASSNPAVSLYRKVGRLIEGRRAPEQPVTQEEYNAFIAGMQDTSSLPWQSRINHVSTTGHGHGNP
jgi:hypothetical protein